MRQALSIPILILAACTAAPAPSTSQPTVSGPTRTGHVAPTRSPVECRTLVDQVRAHPADFHGTEPKASRIEVAEVRELARASGSDAIPVRMLVDELGEVVKDSIMLEPRVASLNGARDLKAALARYRFHPSVLEGCAVPAWTSLTFRVNG